MKLIFSPKLIAALTNVSVVSLPEIPMRAGVQKIFVSRWN